jgi:hypothetical protein
MNNAAETQTISVSFSKVPAFSSASPDTLYSIRDVWNHADIEGQFTSYDVTLASHDSAFFVVSAV